MQQSFLSMIGVKYLHANSFGLYNNICTDKLLNIPLWRALQIMILDRPTKEANKEPDN